MKKNDYVTLTYVSKEGKEVIELSASIERETKQEIAKELHEIARKLTNREY